MKIHHLDTIKQNALNHFKTLKEKYPQADGTVMIQSRGQYFRFNEDPRKILAQCPDFFEESAEREACLVLLKEIKSASRAVELDKKKLAIDMSLLEAQLKEAILQLNINPYGTVDIIWEDHDYDLIRKLRIDDDHVDVSRTPQVGGIRIVLGTLLSFM